MQIEETGLPGLKVLTPARFGDARGFFSESWNKRRLQEQGIDLEFVQDNHSLSVQAGTLRGLHFQAPPHAQDKLVRCGRGALFDVAVDIRKGSPAYGKWFGIELTAENGKQLLVPKGFLHGFLTRVAETEVIYKCTDYYAPEAEGMPARIRAYASFDADKLGDGTPFEQLSDGYFAVLLDQGKGTEPYSGITPIAGDGLKSCAEAYFAQSEQLPTRFALSFGRSTEADGPEHWRAGGVMLQHMPKASPFAQGGGSGEGGLLEARDIVSGDEGENWTRANALLDTVEQLELIGPSVAPTELLVRLFHEESPRVYEAQPIRFGCSCSEERVRNSLSIYSARDIATMTTEEGLVTADCQFCGAHYRLDPKTLGFDAAEPASGDG